jgi:hypothetical protein
LASKELNLLLYGDDRPFLQASFLNFRSISTLRELSDRSSAYARTPKRFNPHLYATGTPSAVLVDAEGKVASEIGVGAQAVLALARYDRTEA